MTAPCVMVTGAGGYIGSILTELLLVRGYRVIALDRFFFGPTLDHLRQPRLKIIKGDIRWIGAEVFRGVDAVCDLAALSNDPSGELDPATTMAINADGRGRIARLARSMGTRRYVLASSCSVYGFQETCVDETSSTNPLTTYARANLRAENLNLELCSETFSVTALRQATVYGLSPRMRFDLVLNAMTLSLLERGTVSVQRDGSQWRPLIHVRDTARAFVDVLEADAELVNGQVFNVGSDQQNIRMFDLAQRIAVALDLPFAFTWYGREDHRSYRVSFRKIRSVLGYIPDRSPEDGTQEIARAFREGRTSPGPMTRTVEWYQRLFESGRI